MIAEHVQKLGCSPGPRVAGHHKCADRYRDRIGLSYRFNRLRCCVPECLNEDTRRKGSARNRPQRKIGHSRQSLKSNVRQLPQAMSDAIQ